MKPRLFICCLLFSATGLFARTDIDADLGDPGHPIQPTLFGIFFEDINFGADGGLYAELIKNRSFEFDHPLTGWLPYGNVEIRTDDPCFPANPHYARLSHRGRILTGTGLENEGFRGIGYKKGETYKFSMYARNLTDEPATFRIDLINDGEVSVRKEFQVTEKEWTKVSVDLVPRSTASRGSVRITLRSQGEVDLDHISLFPEKTWKNRENGMREDLVQALMDLNPGLFRFPGGCIVEGTTLETRYQWKNSIGPVENRPFNINRWNYTYHRKAHDYYQSYGIGFYEYFLLSEDLGAEPLPVLSCGLACQYENPDEAEFHVSLEELEPYIQDALDLIEFANGPIDTRWGRVRAEMGHPEPFHLKYIGIGNEQWGPMYPERLALFVDAIRERHPEIRIVGGSGPSADGERFDYLWPEMKRLGVDLVDEHYYMPPEFFYGNADRYDHYDRNGPKVFAGEYAAHHPSRANNFDTALSEAAFMTGLERNADMVHMATYAPLLAHIDAWQWRPDLIWFDNLSVSRTPNYYVQQFYGKYTGDRTVPVTSEGQPLTGQRRIYASGSADSADGTFYLKIVNADNRPEEIIIRLNGGRPVAENGKVHLLQSDDLTRVNEVGKPEMISPTVKKIKIENGQIRYTAPAQSFQVIEFSEIR